MIRANPYQPGGTLLKDSYIIREADEKLQKAILDNTSFPYFLAARQSGKSSILAHTRSILNLPEFQIAIVDLSAFEPVSLDSYENFVVAFVSAILREINCDDTLRARIDRAEKEPLFLLESIRAILAHIKGRLVICIDEIDALRRYDFKDIFLGQIRAVFNRRYEQTLNRIQFVLAGAASSEDLISDLRQSPFNVGKDIELEDLSSDKVKQLVLQGWPLDTPGIDEAIQKLVYWTSGSVFLCQDILHRSYEEFFEKPNSRALPQVIEQSVANVLEESARELHFRNIRRNLNADVILLNKWREWTNGQVPDKGIINDLSIIGICRQDEPFRNRLYQLVFGHYGPLSLFESASPEFAYDVFLSHSSRDKEVVRELAERLRADGLRVWFDSWEIKPGDSIPHKIDDGLKHARVLVLCLSAQAAGSEWAQVESYTFHFRDPLNRQRRFIPLRLDAFPIEDALAQFSYINWLPEARAQEYPKLLAACRPPAPPLLAEAPDARGQFQVKSIYLDCQSPIYAYAFSPDGNHALLGANDHTVRLWDVEAGRCLRVLKGHTAQVRTVAWSDDRRLALSGSRDNTVRLWDVETGRCLRLLESHTHYVNSVVWGTDQRHALSSSYDKTMRLWDVENGRCLRIFKGHTSGVLSVAWSADQRRILSGSYDRTVRLWDVETGRCLRVFEGHTHAIWQVTWSADQHYALSSSEDNTVRLWEVETGRCLRVLEGHTRAVWSGRWSTDRRLALSGSRDNTVRLWDVETGRCLCVFEGHASPVMNVTWSADEHRAFSGDKNGNIRVWDLTEFVTEARAPKSPAPTTSPAPDQVQYTNAKVLLVGDSGVGKTGLANYLALGIKDEGRNASTDGAWAAQWKLPHTAHKDGVEREIWLWDFAGQVDYRLVHQLFMDDTAAAVLVFNPQIENPFEGLGQWERDLQKATRKPFAKLLVAGRIDRGGLVVSDASITKFIAERGFQSPLHLTSAKTGAGCDALRDAITAAIDWQSIPETTSPTLYQRMKQEILSLRDSGLVLIRLAELKQRMELALVGERFELAELQTVVGLLAGPGMIQRVDFGGFILLRPEVLSRYAAAVVRQVRQHPQELGCIREDELLAGKLDYQDFARLLDQEDEAVVLRALHETFVSRAWCLRQPSEGSALLTFPNYFRRERPTQPSHPNVLVTYRFTGPVDDIYATLVVRLHYTAAFQADQLWKDAADFKTQNDKSLGLKLTREAEGTARLEVYFNPEVDENSRLIFLRYVHNHLTEHARAVQRLRHYFCGNRRCDAYQQLFTEQAKIDKALLPGGEGKVFCPDCGKAILLRDVTEQKFDSPAVKEEARKLQIESQHVIDNESRELILIGHAFTITAEAGQIYRGYPNSDHGIDGEIEFKDDQGRATGERLYLQLKSGDSYLIERQRDGAEVFQIKNADWAEYWRQQAHPVLLVTRNSDGEIRWMDVREYLRRAQPPVKQIAFAGERFDVMSVRRWRDKMLRQDSQ